ncbi:MAG: galactose mutarotase [Acidobacteriaceae bacterium]|nr:galactose mutarotase [Acidobacteriaceae bacterium]
MLKKTVAAAILMSAAMAHAGVKKTSWGKMPDGTPVELYTLDDGVLKVKITNFGAHLVSVEAPDRNGKKADVVLGYKDLAGYLSDDDTYVGAVVGRYGNRIAKGTFSLDGETYHVPLNDHGNALHGGTVGFDRKVWTGKVLPDGVELTLVSPDGDMGFPGALTAHIRYTLHGDRLQLEYSATTTKPTVLNLTSHAYYNLAGEGNGNVLGQKVTINADRYTPVKPDLIPTGELAPVDGTPLDFRKSTAIGERIDVENDQLKIAGGYDHNYVLNGSGLREAVEVVDPVSGRKLTIHTTQPGVQFYSGNFLAGAHTGPSGVAYGKHAGFCMETQHFPDSPNQPSFPSTELKSGETLHETTVLEFSVAK